MTNEVLLMLAKFDIWTMKYLQIDLRTPNLVHFWGLMQENNLYCTHWHLAKRQLVKATQLCSKKYVQRNPLIKIVILLKRIIEYNNFCRCTMTSNCFPHLCWTFLLNNTFFPIPSTASTKQLKTINLRVYRYCIRVYFFRLFNEVSGRRRQVHTKEIINIPGMTSQKVFFLNSYL